MIISAVIALATIGFCCGLLLAVGARVFHVDEDPRIEAVRWALPGANCGLCGFPGCLAAAKAVVAGKAGVAVCLAGSTDVAAAVAAAMGHDAYDRQRKTAAVSCKGGARAASRFVYRGAPDCRAAALLSGGILDCDKGCLGLGSCQRACRFGAIVMDRRGLPAIDTGRCRGCGLCLQVCPSGCITVTTLTHRLIRMEETGDCLSPCTQKCPAHIDVPRFVRHVQDGELAAALLTIKERNPLPLTCGRVCPHPCENICRRNIADEGVGLIWLQRYLAQWEMNSGERLALPCAPATDRRIAVIGGGPAGLSCAYFLKRIGHQPVIFEAMPELGGMIRYAIPQYRLPKHEVKWEIDGILALGIEVRTRTRLGIDFNLQDLARQGFDAVFIGIGAWIIPMLGIPGESARGVVASIDFLDRIGTQITSLENRRVVVLGESNTAMDCARSAIRLGAAGVDVICPCDDKHMSARKRDVVRAVEEGVRIFYQMRPVRIVTDDQCRVSHVACVSTADEEALPTEQWISDGRPRALISADMVIRAVERKPDIDALAGALLPHRLSLSGHGTIAVNPLTMQTSIAHVFAAGDAQSGRASVIQAVAGGRRAARAIHHFLIDGAIAVPAAPHQRINPVSILKQVTVTEAIPKVRVPELPANIRRRSFVEEVVGSISEKEALQEARRCLCCGLTCYDR
ncbi:MAG: FAD-dependent oxidoreductase [Pseudomonadota bacterium]